MYRIIYTRRGYWIISLGAVLLLLLSMTVAAQALGSATGIGWRVLSSGGGSASGGSVTLDSTLGQPITGVSSGGSAWLGAGYWYAEQPVQLYLPMLRR